MDSSRQELAFRLQAIEVEAHLVAAFRVVEDFLVQLGGLGLAEFIQYFEPSFHEDRRSRLSAERNRET